MMLLIRMSAFASVATALFAFSLPFIAPLRNSVALYIELIVIWLGFVVTYLIFRRPRRLRSRIWVSGALVLAWPAYGAVWLIIIEHSGFPGP